MRAVTRGGTRSQALAVAPLVVACAVSCAPSEREQPGAEQPAATRAAPSRVQLETTKGRIVIELDRHKAPETVANFLLHVRSKFYDGLVFHRVVRDLGVIQAGVLTPARAERRTSVFPIANEATNGLKNVRGAVAMARGGDPHSATSQFFINVKDNPQFDFRDSTDTGWGYAVFGRVVEGMDVVDAIAAVPVRPWGTYASLPVEPVVIERAVIVEND